ncbi:MAG: amidase [Candidatus Promineifilaceae bacterium]
MIDLNLLDTVGLVEAIRQKQVSAVELLSYVMARVEQHNPRLNAVVQTDFEAAMMVAKSADATLAQTSHVGPLHGIPMTLKDCWEVVGFRATAGAVALKDYRPKTNAPTVQRLLDAGAIVYGKTNTPPYAMDVQTYNDIFGVTNNPHNVARTSGGSSGGAAAAVAAGFTTLEVGSDIGGSIRTPAHYCGVYGHKPTHNIIPMQGHIPGSTGVVDLAVAGPIARSARDLKLALDVLAAPDALNQAGWQLRLPKPRHELLRDFRVAIWLDDETCPVESEMLAQFDSVVETLQKAGATVTKAIPVPLPDILAVYYTLLASFTGASLPKSQYNHYAKLKEDLPVYQAKYGLPASFMSHVSGRTATHRQWLGANERRAKMQYQLKTFFNEYDVLLTPITPNVAPLHNHTTSNMEKRRILINGQQRPYVDQFPWIALATATGFPATSAPIGTTRSGLPVNIQIIGSYLEDQTTIKFSELLAEAHEGVLLSK